MTIRIPDGNAFRIRLTARNLITGEYTEAADLHNIDNLVINYVRRGIRFPHAYTIDEEGRATVADAGTLDCGFYGIELTGYYGGEKFRFYGKDLFEITTDTTDVIDPSNLIDIEITVKLNASGVSKDYVDHAINGMEASMETMQADLRDEIAEAGKVDDVKVNGESVVSGKKANITVPTKVSDLDNDSGYQNEQQVQQKVDAAKITSVDISVDGGTGTPSGSAGVSGNKLVLALHNIQGQKGDPGESIVGPRGPQGATGVYDQTTQQFLTTLETTTGESQTKTMTQKAITDELRYGWQPLDRAIQVVGALYPSGTKYKTDGISSNTASGFMEVTPGEIIRISPLAEDMNYRYAIVRNNTYANNQEIPVVGTLDLSWKDTPEVIEIPDEGAYIFMTTKTNKNNHTPKFDEPVTTKDKLSEVNEKIINNGFASELEKGVYLKRPYVGSIMQGYRLNTSAGIEASVGWNVSPYIPLPSSGTRIVIAFASIPETGVDAMQFYDKDFKYQTHLATAGGGNTNSYFRVFDVPNWDSSKYKYARISYTLLGLLAIDDVVLWSSGASVIPEHDDTFLAGTAITKLGAVGNDSNLIELNLGHLKAGARYRIVPENMTAWESWRPSQTNNQIRFQISYLMLDGTTKKYLHAAYNCLPVPPFVDFIAEENICYYLAMRGPRQTPLNFKLIGPPEDNRLLEEKSLVRQAHYIGVDSGVYPSLGLLHISDLHGDQVAAVGILDALERYKEYIDDGIATGDVVNYASGATATYPEGTAWWQATGLPEKMLFTLGNHDNATTSATEYDQKEDSECWDGKGAAHAFEQYFSPYIAGLGYVMPAGYDDSTSPYYQACFWHKDYTQQKVRVIGLDCIHRFDGIMAFDETSGRWEISGEGLKHKTDEQEQWLFDRLMDTLTPGSDAYGFSVVVCGHYPLDEFSGDNMQWDENAHKFICNRNGSGGSEGGGRVINQKTNEVVNFSYYATEQTNYDKKFVWLNRVDDGYSQGEPWPNYKKGTVNNVGNIIQKWQQDGGKFVAFFSGHVHADLMYYPKNYPDMLNIAINQAGGIRPNNLGDKSDLTYGRMVANYYAIDTFHGYLKIVRIGMKDTMHLMSLRYLCYDYINRKVISEG